MFPRTPFFTPSMSATINPLSLATAVDMSARSTAKGPPSVKSTSTSASAGSKRKRTTEAKFYAVRIGKSPGVYFSWPDCLAQVKGFKNATCE